jgi:hypothetical protein
MRRNGLLEAIGIHIAKIGFDIGRLQQRHHIFIQFTRRTARCHRLHRRHAQALRAQRVNQRHRHPRFADAGIGTGDKKTFHTKPSLRRRWPMLN